MKNSLRCFAVLSATVLCLASMAKASVLSSNAGVIPGTGIQYTVSLADDDAGRVGMQFSFKNTSSKTYHIPRSTFDVPGYLAVFFSTEQTPIISSNEDWVRKSSFSGEISGNLQLAPGQTVEEIFPVAVYYDKIYKKRQISNVYVYWGLTVPTNSDDADQAALEHRSVKPITQTLLPRIGGMLTLPKRD